MSQNPDQRSTDDMRPGDQAPPDSDSAGEVSCPDCLGTGESHGGLCETCAGTGRVTQGIGGG